MRIDLGTPGPILCFGGPYSNLQAIAAIRAEADRLRIPPDRVICTGDVIAYCANPNETAELVRDWGCHVIKGNCEEQLAQRAEDCGCGFADGTACDLLSTRWYAFANDALCDDLRQWMAALPATLAFDLGGLRARVIHGGTRETSRFIFASAPAAIKRDELDLAAADIMIAGHCGIPFVQKIGARIWFNPGVIGMPANDATTDGWFGLIDKDARTGQMDFSIKRLRYDAQSAAAALSDAGHVDAYAKALITGLWPSLDVLPETERAQTGQHICETKLAIGQP